MRRNLAATILALAACADSDRPDDNRVFVGECEPPPASTPLAVTATDLFDGGNCLRDRGDLTLADTMAELDAAFDCTSPRPPALDFATQRAALVHVRCTPITHRFTSETAAEIVIGIETSVSGACIANALVIPLPRSTKSVRLASCARTCGSSDCPPVP